jgi:hypothetical protein
MRHLIIVIMIFGLFGCRQKGKEFSESETNLIQNIGFDKEVLIEIKKYVKEEFIQFETSDPGFFMGKDGKLQKTGIEKQNGISFTLPEDKADDIIIKSKDKLKDKGYLIFVSQNGYETPSTVSIIKSTDQFDILKIQKTDGINYDLENEDVIEKLKSWDTKYGIEILGADYDWVDFTITVPSDSIPDFAKEVYEFCPDAVDQGVGEVVELEKMIGEFKRLVLWWD